MRSLLILLIKTLHFNFGSISCALVLIIWWPEYFKNDFTRSFKRELCRSLWKTTKIAAKRNSPKFSEIWKETVKRWLADPNFSFRQICIFTDELGFNFHIVRNQERSKKGELAKVVVVATRSPSVSMLGFICSLDAVNLELKVTKARTKWKEIYGFLD